MILLSEFVQRALGVAHDRLVVEVVLHHHKHEPHQDHEARGLHDLYESVLSVNIMNPWGQMRKLLDSLDKEYRLWMLNFYKKEERTLNIQSIKLKMN